ncbi:MAG: metallophosphoesterase [Magnetococcales bacterium]|nr:metallophosphoesterase [Nitrospirota bacterium]
MSEVTILHVSDLHMEERHRRDIDIILGALYTDLVNLRDKESIKPDIVVFTGDLVKAGNNADEFALAESKLITPLMETLGLSKDQFFFVPGNHDIENDDSKQIIATGVRTKYDTTSALNGFLDKLDLKENTFYFENSSNFRALRDRIDSKHKVEANKLFSTYKVNVKGIDIGIGCLNSAWLAYTGKSDERKVLVCKRQVDSILDYIGNCDIKIALMHHPLDWLVDFDRKDVEGILRQKFDFLFTGHLHNPEPNFTKNARGSLFHFEGGTLVNDDRKTKYHGYTIIKIEHDKIGVYLRKYIDNRWTFDKDVDRASDGYLSFEREIKQPPKTDAPKPPDANAVIISMLDDMQGRLKVPLYIPLTCAHDISIRQSAIDLKDEVDKFLADKPQSGVLLLLGDSGAGKSTFCAWLFAGLKDAYLKDAANAPLPVFIKLGPLSEGVRAGTFVDDELRLYGLDRSAIERLKHGKQVIFFLDGYDELGEKIWLFQEGWINSWTNANVIITCRNQHISTGDDFSLFYRADPLTNRPDKEGFRSLYITPFSESKVDAYLQKFVKTLVAAEEQWKKPDTYKKLIITIYNLKELSSNPLLLNIIVKTMPSLVKDDKTSSINRNRIYTKFITEWFEKEIIKVQMFRKKTCRISYFFKYAEKLAFEMFLEGVTQIKLPEDDPFDEDEPVKCLLHELLTSEDSNYAKFRSGCPIQRVKDDTFTFMHKSYQEYFAARRLQRAISEGSNGALNDKLLTEESAIIAFLSEMEVENPALLNIVKESKTNGSIEIASSNAATILNVRRFSFSGLDLSGVCIPEADLSCAVLDSTNLSGADLYGVSFRQAFLRDTNLIGSLMEAVEFGEMPYLQGHSDTVSSVAISPDGTKIVSGSRDHSVKVWDIATGRLLWTTNPRLYCVGAQIDGVTGLLNTNRRLLLQQGAVDGGAAADRDCMRVIS